MPAETSEEKLIQKLRELEKENIRLKNASQAIEGFDGRYRSFIENSDDAILICDREAKAIFWNPAYVELTKYICKVPVVSGLELYQALPGDGKTEWLDTLNHQILTGKTVKKEYSIDSDHNTHHLEVTYSPAYENEHITGFSILVRDITKQKLTEEELTNFKQAVDASADAIGLSTAQGKHYYQNTSFDHLFGDIGNDPPGTLYTNEKVGREIFATIMNGAPWVGEVEMNGKDGNPLIIFLRAYPVKDSDGHVRRLVGVHTNITRQKQTEEELLNFKQAVDASTDAIGMSTALGEHYYQNASFDHLFGKIGNDPPGSLYADEQIGREVFESIMGGTPWIGEVEMHGKDQNILNILLRAYPTMDSDGNVRRLFGVHTDITKQKQTEKELLKHREHLQDLVTERTRELQESEARFRQISDNINDVFYLYSVDYKQVYYVSQGFEKLWGKNIQELYDNSWIFAESIHEDDRHQVEEFKSRILDTLNFKDAAIEYRIINADESIRWIRDEMFPVYDLTGSIVRIAGSARDITRIKTAEEALHRSREKSRDLSRYLQRAVEDERIRIAREIHDDLGQTLIAMKMNLVSCRKKLPDHLDPLFETALNMELTIDQMIQSIKIMISDLRAGPLSDLGLEAAIEWLANNFFKDLDYNTKIELHTESVDIDPNRGLALFRIAQESLTNIVRHSDASIVKVKLFIENDLALLQISDNGSGIADTSALPNDSYGIMGMKERARFFKGDLHVESNEEGGTTITASIPIND